MGKWSAAFVKLPVNAWLQILHIDLFGCSYLTYSHVFTLDFGGSIVFLFDIDGDCLHECQIKLLNIRIFYFHRLESTEYINLS